MLKNKVVQGLCLGGLLLTAGSAAAQGLGNSPYSRLGLGDYNPNLGGIRQASMGGVGIAAPNAVNPNELNPALLYYTSRTTYEAAFHGQYKTVKNATAVDQTGTGTLDYLALAVPLNQRWGAAIGLKPLSAVDYSSETSQPVQGDPNGAVAYSQFKGTGGLSEVYFAHGVHVARDLNLGATASYVFGTVEQTAGNVVVPAGGDITSLQPIVDREKVRYSDIMFRAAAHYRHELSKNLNLNVGAVYTFGSDLKGTRLRTQERQNYAGAVIGLPTVLDAEKGRTTMPALTQVGITLDNAKNWTASLDVAQQQWSKFQGFNQPLGSLDNTLRIGLGGEFTPDPGSVDHYFRRVTYRAGLSVAQLPFRPGGQTLYDRAVSWGFAFPLPISNPLEATTFTLGFTYGMRGNTDYVNGSSGESNVQENYVRMQVGVTLNNRWFIKRRLQ